MIIETCIIGFCGFFGVGLFTWFVVTHPTSGPEPSNWLIPKSNH